MNLINGDCLIELKKLKDKSIDFVYLDLPYGQTACSWDNKLDHHALWVELKRIAKNDRTPFFFSCTTKFGFELYNTAPKGWFRWDLVWEKNRAAGFLNAYKLPLRKHELVYCFAKKSPDYDVSSHLTGKTYESTKAQAEIYGKMYDGYTVKETKDPLPTSILPPQEDHELVYCFAKKSPDYDVSSHSEYVELNRNETIKGGKQYGCKEEKRTLKQYKEPLPTSILPPQDIPSSWCKYKLDEGINHRTSKPVKLMEFLLKYWSKESDTILDPTAGSGSMGVACMNMNRKCILIEKDPDIFAIMKDRLDKHSRGEKVVIKPKKKPKKQSK